jgi:hypothetical protein
VYARDIEGRELTFGVSGLLYRSNLLMYDHQTESLWLQVKRRAVSGPLEGEKLKVFPSTVTTWEKWRRKHPGTVVLGPDTGHRRNYAADPYEDYYRSRRGLFSRWFTPGPGEEEKEMVAGIELGGVAKAYPVDTLREKGTVSDRIGEENITLSYDRTTDRIDVRSGGGEGVEAVTVYWFVWKGIHPLTLRYRGEDE